MLIIGPREFEAMMDIPGFRNAVLLGMSRRIREADDKVAAIRRAGRRSAAACPETPTAR